MHEKINLRYLTYLRVSEEVLRFCMLFAYALCTFSCAFDVRGPVGERLCKLRWTHGSCDPDLSAWDIMRHHETMWVQRNFNVKQSKMRSYEFHNSSHIFIIFHIKLSSKSIFSARTCLNPSGSKRCMRIFSHESPIIFSRKTFCVNLWVTRLHVAALWVYALGGSRQTHWLCVSF